MYAPTTRLGSPIAFIWPASSHNASSQKRSTNRRVRHEEDRFPAPLEFRELVEALVGEPFVADGEDLVDEEDIGIDVYRHGKAETHIHPRRICLHRRVDELFELGKLDDLFEAGGDLALGETEHDAVDEDVLASGDLGVEPRTQLDERRDSTVHHHRPRRRFRNAGHQLQHRALARPVAADDTERPPGRYREGHVPHGGKRLVRLQVANQAARQQRALQRRKLTAPAVAAVDLRGVAHFDGVHE